MYTHSQVLPQSNYKLDLSSPRWKSYSVHCTTWIIQMSAFFFYRINKYFYLVTMLRKYHIHDFFGYINIIKNVCTRRCNLMQHILTMCVYAILQASICYKTSKFVWRWIKYIKNILYRLIERCKVIDKRSFV